MSHTVPRACLRITDMHLFGKAFICTLNQYAALGEGPAKHYHVHLDGFPQFL